MAVLGDMVCSMAVKVLFPTPSRGSISVCGPIIWDTLTKNWSLDGSGTTFEPLHEKTKNFGFRPGQTQTGLYSHRSKLEACNFKFKKKRDCTICVAKTKMLISCVFIFGLQHLRIYATVSLILYCNFDFVQQLLVEPRCEKTGLRGF